MPDASGGIVVYTVSRKRAYGVTSMQILLADNQPQVRFGLCVLLEHQPGIEIVGQAANARDLLAQSKTACPDLILLDWKLPKMRAVDLLASLRKICPNVAVIVLSGRPEARQAALDAGADGFVGKYELPEKLLAAITQCRCAQESCQPDRDKKIEEAPSC
jgi:DNA-binding NarL/FixJ family response regulator